MRHALMAPHDVAWYYRPKRGKYRRRTDVPATKPKKQPTVLRNQPEDRSLNLGATLPSPPRVV